MERKLQIAEARVENLRSELEMKEDIAREIKAAFDRQNALNATYASVSYSCNLSCIFCQLSVKLSLDFMSASSQHCCSR